MALLDGLDAVDWGAVSHAYGPAVDVPPLLRALVDPANATERLRAAAAAAGRGVRDHVIWTLYGNVFHQGTVWQASPKVVPFLVEILRDGPREPELQRFVLEYLHHLAYGYPQDLFPHLIDPEAQFAGSDGAPPGPSGDALMVGYARDCYRGVEGALPAVAPLCRDADEGVALAAIALVGGFRARASPEVLRAVAAEATGARLGAALVALAQLDPDAAFRSAAPHLSAPDRLLAVHAAAACVLANPERADGAVGVLAAPLGDLAEAESALAGTLGTLVSRCLELLPERHAARAAAAIAATLAGANPVANLSATAALLRLVLPGGAPDSAAALTRVQRDALEAVAAHGAFMFGDASFGNYAQLLRDWGLPTRAAALSAWLSGPGA